MSLADRYTARQNADGTWTVRVTRRYLAGFLGYRDETRTYVTARRPSSPGAAWAEAERIAREAERRYSPRALRKRGKLTAGLLSVPCTECGAVPGDGCDPDNPVFTEMIRLDKSPPLVIHTGRMADAITAGKVKRALVLAQFDGPPPAAVANSKPRPASRLGARCVPARAPALASRACRRIAAHQARSSSMILAAVRVRSSAGLPSGPNASKT